MYNGIGLTTVRGSATSGHVSKNMSYIKPEFFRNKLDSNLSAGRQGDARRGNGGANFKVNKDVIEHNRKHALESQVFEFEDSLREKGSYTEDEIEAKVADFRANQQQRQLTNLSSKTARTGRATDTHEISARKNEENEKLRSAFGIGKDFVSGASFDPVIQEQRRKEREEQKAAKFEQNKLDRERREQEQLERRKIQDQIREERNKRDTEDREDRESRGGEKRNRDDSRDRRRDSRDSRDRDRNRTERGRRGRSDSPARRDSRNSRDRSSRWGAVKEAEAAPVESAKAATASVEEEEGEICSPAEKRGPSRSSRSRSRSVPRDSRGRQREAAAKRGRSPSRSRSRSPARKSNRRSRSASSSSSSSASSSSSSGSSRSGSSSSSGSRSRSRSSDRKRGRRGPPQAKRGRSRS